MRHSVIPAYGRDYKSKKAVLESLAQGHDFLISNIMSKWDNKPMSIRDTKGMDTMQVRYGKLRKVAMLTAKEVGDARMYCADAVL